MDIEQSLFAHAFSILVKQLMCNNFACIGSTSFENCTRLSDYERSAQSGTEVIKNVSSSKQLSMEIILLINVKMPTIAGILTLMSRKNSNTDISEPEKSRIS